VQSHTLGLGRWRCPVDENQGKRSPSVPVFELIGEDDVSWRVLGELFHEILDGNVIELFLLFHGEFVLVDLDHESSAPLTPLCEAKLVEGILESVRYVDGVWHRGRRYDKLSIGVRETEGEESGTPSQMSQVTGSRSWIST